MSSEEIIARIRSALGDQLLGLQQPRAKRVYVDVPADVIPTITQLLYHELHARLQTASGMDAPHAYEILYHWAFDSLGLLVTLRTEVNRERPELASITPICPAAEWIEREMWELLGIHFIDHPDLRHLLLKDDWPEGKFPLRRDYHKE